MALGIAVVIVVVAAGVMLRMAWEVIDWPLSLGAPQAYLSQVRVDLYECSDFTYHEDAQAVYDQDPGDPYGLDGPPGEAYEGVKGVELAKPCCTVRGSYP